MPLVLALDTKEHTFQLTVTNDVYELTDDIKGNLIRGNNHEISGWLHIEIKSGIVSDMIVRPTRLLESKEGGCVSLCSGDGVRLRDIKLYSPVPLDWFAVGNATTTVKKCQFYGVEFDDPPESGYVLRI